VASQANDANRRLAEDSAPPAPGRLTAASLVDPEDDLPSASCAGDFETTTIPHYGPGGISRGPVGAAGSDYGLLGVQQALEPLPYGHPQSSSGNAAFKPAGMDPAGIDFGEEDERLRVAGRRGNQDLGQLVLRAGLGVVLVAHGLHKLFGWDGRGLAGFKNALSDIGYQHAEILTCIAAGGEIAAGLFLVLGLFTPIAAAGALAYLINGLLAGISAKPGSRSFSFFLPYGYEYEVILMIFAAAVILIGPGRYGLDAGRGWARRPFIGSFAALLAGAGAGVAVWVLLNGANPLT
jgi:putative oxidoreductase